MLVSSALVAMVNFAYNVHVHSAWAGEFRRRRDQRQPAVLASALTLSFQMFVPSYVARASDAAPGRPFIAGGERDAQRQATCTNAIAAGDKRPPWWLHRTPPSTWHKQSGRECQRRSQQAAG